MGICYLKENFIQYGVSDNAVNKWCKFYEIKKPGRGDWEKIKFGKLDIPKQ